METAARPSRALRVRESSDREHPRERLIDLGCQALSTAELIALAIGAKIEVGSLIFSTFGGSLRRIARDPVAALTTISGVSIAKATQLHAAMELGRRLAGEERAPGAPIQSPRDVVQYAAPRMEDLPVEEFHVLILDAQHRMERDVTVTRGILNSSLVHPREVFREAIAERAAAVILLHNHPSGDPAPSADDRAVTEQLAAAGRVLDIPVHDHIIIGRGKYTSFAEAGLL